MINIMTKWAKQQRDLLAVTFVPVVSLAVLRLAGKAREGGSQRAVIHTGSLQPLLSANKGHPYGTFDPPAIATSQSKIRNSLRSLVVGEMRFPTEASVPDAKGRQGWSWEFSIILFSL